MLAGDFARNIKKLNPHLRISCGDDAKRPAMLYFSVNCNSDDDRDYIEICAVDKNYLPERTIIDETNHIVKGGWRRAMNMLISRKLVDKKRAERLFQTGFDHAVNVELNKINDPILRAIKDAQERNAYRRGNEKIFDRSELMDIGRMVSRRKK